MRTYIKNLLIGIIIAVNIFLWFYYDLRHIITIDALKNNRDALLAIVNRYYVLSLIGYVACYILDAIFFLPITAILIISGGFLFGIFPTLVCTIIGATIGGTSAFLIARYLLGITFQTKYHRQLATFNKQLAIHGTYYLLFSRIVPIFPFSLVNILTGLTLIPTGTFVWTTACGIIPNTIIYAYIGKQLVGFDSIRSIFTPQLIGAILLLILITILSLVLHHKKGLFTR